MPAARNGRHHPRDVLVLGRRGSSDRPRTADVGAQLGEDRRDLRPVAPAPITSSDSGTIGQRPRVTMRAHQLRTRHRQEPVAFRQRTEIICSARRLRPSSAIDRMRVDEPRGSRGLVHRHPGVVQLGTRRRVIAYVGDHLTHPREQPPVVQCAVANLDSVPVQMPRLATQPRCLRQHADRHRAVLGRHSAHRTPADQGGTGTETTSLPRRGQTGRTAADDHHIDSLPGCRDSGRSDRRADRGDRATGRHRHCMSPRKPSPWVRVRLSW